MDDKLDALIEARIYALEAFAYTHEEKYQEALKALQVEFSGSLTRHHKALLSGLERKRKHLDQVIVERLRDFGRTKPLDSLRVEPYGGSMPDYTP